MSSILCPFLAGSANVVSSPANTEAARQACAKARPDVMVYATKVHPEIAGVDMIIKYNRVHHLFRDGIYIPLSDGDSISPAFTIIFISLHLPANGQGYCSPAPLHFQPHIRQKPGIKSIRFARGRLSSIEDNSFIYDFGGLHYSKL
jgi:hypothetical protein